jgi:hypothetical protein
MAGNDIQNIFTEEPKPKNRLRISFTVLFIVAWLTVMGTGVYNVSVLRRSSPTPTGSRTEPLSEHGVKVYVTEADSDEIHLLNTIAWIGYGTVIITGFALAYFYIFPPRRKRKRNA